MAAAMVTPEMLLIQQEYNDQLAILQKNKKQSERKEYNRIATAKKLSRDREEAKIAVKQINKIPSANDGDTSSSTDDDTDIAREEVITIPSPKGKQRATKPRNLTPDGGEISSPRSGRG